ncbi:LiaI-LiaF-like domain-containing protein [Gracilibacillus phocaeensis]|uniref:LiaI-LiaF-like domain-containing protein n=1 Tax=Gracilibacillus phocaeensis TaxID=2042304 RepID=UPI003307013D
MFRLKKNGLMAYLLIGIGVFFLLRELHLPILTDFYSWPTLFILIGAAFLIYAFNSKEYKQIFPGVVLLGFGIHFHGLAHYPFWIDHWGMYTLIISLAFLIRAFKTKKGVVPGLLLLALSLFVMFVNQQPGWFSWVYQGMNWLERFWPVLLIAIGFYLLLKKK